MTAQKHLSLVAILLVTSLCFEISILGNLFTLNKHLYHAIHVGLIFSVAISQFLFAIRLNSAPFFKQLSLLLALGITSTGIGDFINSALSAVEPVSLKLTWALLWFGIGYSLYVIALYKLYQHIKKSPNSLVGLGLLIIPGALLNVAAWFYFIEHLVSVSSALYYGSFIFNITIYVALPAIAFLVYKELQFSVAALLVYFGSLLIPFSDLVLFATWLIGNPPQPSTLLYSYNWIVYFSGQGLIALLPAIAYLHQNKKTST